MFKLFFPTWEAEREQSVKPNVVSHNTTSEWLFPQEKATLHTARDFTRIGEPL
jgi:hypothetical protein